MTYDRDGTNYIDLNSLKKLNGLQIIQLNVRSLYHKFPAIRHDFVNSSMDIIGFTETLLNPQIPNSLIGIDNYSVVRNDRMYGRGGGTCLYIRHGISYTVNGSFSNRLVEMQSILLTGEIKT